MIGTQADCPKMKADAEARAKATAAAEEEELRQHQAGGPALVDDQPNRGQNRDEEGTFDHCMLLLCEAVR